VQEPSIVIAFVLLNDFCRNIKLLQVTMFYLFIYLFLFSYSFVSILLCNFFISFPGAQTGFSY